MEVDKSISQFYTDSALWSLSIQTHCDHFDYWYCTLRTKMRIFTSKNTVVVISIASYPSLFLLTLFRERERDVVNTFEFEELLLTTTTTTKHRYLLTGTSAMPQ